MNKTKEQENILTQVHTTASRAEVNASAHLGATFRPCGFGLECTIDGVVRNINTQHVLKHQFMKDNGVRTCCYFEGKTRYPRIGHLVARAWKDDWYEGCAVFYLDGDATHVHADNLEICSPRSYNARKMSRALQRKCAEQMEKYGLFAPCGVDDIECTTEGVFRRHGIIYHPCKTSANLRLMSKLCITVEGKRKYYNTAELVYRAWKKDYNPDMVVIRKDDNPYNNNLDNLEQVTPKIFNKWQNSTTNEGRIPTIDEEKARLKEIQMECQLNIDYLTTGSFDGYNEYISKTLHRYLMNYTIQSLDKSRSMAEHLVHDAIIELYELIETNRMVFSPKMFCIRRLQGYVKEGRTLSPYHRLPKKINNEIVKLNLDELCKKFKPFKQRHKNML